MTDRMSTGARMLILGLGNTILSDDAVGIVVARRIYEALVADGGRDDVDFAESSYAGWRLIDMLAGYDRVVIVDALAGRDVPPGECRRVELREISSLHLQTSHGLGLEEAMELARRGGQRMPGRIAVYAVAVNNPFEFGERIDPAVVAKIPAAAEMIIAEEQLKNA